MDKKSFTDKVKDILAKAGLKLSEEAPAAKVFLITAKLKEGSEIHSTAETWDVGADCFFKDADGQESAVPNGNYEMEDGTMITVTEGLITEMKPAEVADMTQENESLKSALAAIQTEAEAEITELTSERDLLKTELAKVKTELVAAKAKAEALGKLVPRKPAAKPDTTERKPLGHADPIKEKIREGMNKFVRN